VPGVPNPIVECAGCGEELSELRPYLKIMVKAEMKVMLSQPTDTTEEGEIPGTEIYLGTKSGRGRIFSVHNFDCLVKYAEARAGKEPKLLVHTEEEIYVPEDNRSPEELVDAGELPPEFLSLQTAMAKGGE
jgi:hypothetical protein